MVASGESSILRDRQRRVAGERTRRGRRPIETAFGSNVGLVVNSNKTCGRTAVRTLASSHHSVIRWRCVGRASMLVSKAIPRPPGMYTLRSGGWGSSGTQQVLGVCAWQHYLPGRAGIAPATNLRQMSLPSARWGRIFATGHGSVVDFVVRDGVPALQGINAKTTVFGIAHALYLALLPWRSADYADVVALAPLARAG